MSDPVTMRPTTTAKNEVTQRTGHGITVTLLWNAQTNRVFVAVVEDPHGVSFEFEVPGADAAEAFHHPYLQRAAFDNNYLQRQRLVDARRPPVAADRSNHERQRAPKATSPREVPLRGHRPPDRLEMRAGQRGGRVRSPHFWRCRSPITYRHLAPGFYFFPVRALSPQGPGPLAKRGVLL